MRLAACQALPEPSGDVLPRVYLPVSTPLASGPGILGRVSCVTRQLCTSRSSWSIASWCGLAGAGSIVGTSCQAGFVAITLGSARPRPNPQKLLVLARDLLVVARDLTAAG